MLNTVKLSRLVTGDAINARSDDLRAEGISELVASIKAVGLLQPLNVMKEQVRYAVGLDSTVAKLVKAERERCAKVAESRFTEKAQYEWAGRQVAAAIRAQQ